MQSSLNVLYVSYDGALDSLGASQVLPYVRGLAALGHQLTLITFEKAARNPNPGLVSELGVSLAEEGVEWHPLVYHQRLRSVSTAYDALVGRKRIARELRRTRAEVIHCRGDVAMAMARWAAAPSSRISLLYDMRGFFAEERAEVGSWRRGGPVDRLVRRAERHNLRRADGLVVLTETARRLLRERGESLPPCRVIPTCVDLDRFLPAPPSARDYGLVYSGSLGTWYLTREMVDLARESVLAGFGRALFLTNQPEEAVGAGVAPGWADVASVPYQQVPASLRRCRAALFLIRATPAKRASCPTKLGEALATGLPVVANSGIGDVDALLERERIGVIVKEFSTAGYRGALHALARLLGDTATAARCRRVAEDYFNLRRGVAEYDSLYQEMRGLMATRSEAQGT